MQSLNNFVAAVENFKKFNPSKANSFTSYIAEKIAYLKEHKRAMFYSTYNVGLLDAIALTDDYSIESIQSLVDALPASDSDSSLERIRLILNSGKGRDAAYKLRDIDAIVNGTSGNRQDVLDATFEALVSWLEVYHAELNSVWNPNKPQVGLLG